VSLVLLVFQSIFSYQQMLVCLHHIPCLPLPSDSPLTAPLASPDILCMSLPTYLAAFPLQTCCSSFLAPSLTPLREPQSRRW
jgi:hypothetical protein